MAIGGQQRLTMLGDEELRQAAVFASGVLAMRDSPRLHAIVERAVALLHVPIGGIAIIDRERQWFAATIGITVQETPRDISLCAHAIASPDSIFCVPDTRVDPRFSANPLITGTPNIRFYVAAPILTGNGDRLGALCAIDTEARERLSPDAEKALSSLAAEAAQEIESVETTQGYGAEAIDQIVRQIRAAAQRADEDLVTALDRILQNLEFKLGSAKRPR